MWWLDVVLYPRLIGLAAADEGLYDTPDIRAFRKWKRDEVLADQVRSLAVADIEVSEEEIRQRYDANPGSFRLEGHVRIEELLLPSEAVATEIRDRIVAGEKFTDLVAHSLRGDARKKGAQFHFHRHEKRAYPRLMAAIEEASDGVVTGPVEVEGGYSVFRVLERVPTAKEPYALARPRARALVLRQRQAEAFDELILQLREKYRKQVVVHWGELTAALPDSVVQGASAMSR
jgi:parvulin-like peptidyl-prolyl isomerase